MCRELVPQEYELEKQYGGKVGSGSSSSAGAGDGGWAAAAAVPGWGDSKGACGSGGIGSGSGMAGPASHAPGPSSHDDEHMTVLC